MRAPDFWRTHGLLSRLLVPLSVVYAAGGRLRWRWTTPFYPPIPVICVGNLVAGGAGKTPVVESLLRYFAERDIAAHALSRGYTGRLKGTVRVEPSRHTAADVGDEPLLLANVAPCWVSADRVAGVEAAAEAGARLVVMDDGYQNPSLAKDLSILVVDGEAGFGNGRVLPAGPLREPLEEGMRRADAVVLMAPVGPGLATEPWGSLPTLGATLSPTAPEQLAGQRVLAFAGIGRPEKFFATLRAMGCEVVVAEAFADHHRYRVDELARLVSLASERDLTPVTTEKDLVRLPKEARPLFQALPVTVVWEDSAALDRLLAPILSRIA